MKVLLINPTIPEYRIHFFNQVGRKVDLTILHSGKEVNIAGLNFKQIIIPLKTVGPFSFYKKSISSLCKRFDIIISEANIRYIDRDLILILNRSRKFKWIPWGIGVSASYNKGFDQNKRLDFVRHFIFKHADAQIFYSSYPVKKYIKAGFDPSSLFVANNTTDVHFSEDKIFERRKMVFVGTLYKQKRIYDLLIAYLEASKIVKNMLELHIIGNGDEYNSIKNWIRLNELEKKVVLHGAIFDHEVLEQHFRESLACFSPGQAGLSVLVSMGYGTPFITKKDAITGGEIFNIENGVNGVVYEDGQSLSQIIIELHNNPAKYEEMGKNARNYYLTNRRIDQMVGAFEEAISFVVDRKGA